MSAVRERGVARGSVLVILLSECIFVPSWSWSVYARVSLQCVTLNGSGETDWLKMVPAGGSDCSGWKESNLYAINLASSSPRSEPMRSWTNAGITFGPTRCE